MWSVEATLEIESLEIECGGYTLYVEGGVRCRLQRECGGYTRDREQSLPNPHTTVNQNRIMASLCRNQGSLSKRARNAGMV